MTALLSQVRRLMDSYSVRCLFRWHPRPDQRAMHLYEERITLWYAEFLHNLAPVLSAAYARVLSLSPGQDVDAMRHLCEKLHSVMAHYEQSVREWMASKPLPNGFEAAHAELEEVRKMLDEWK